MNPLRLDSRSAARMALVLLLSAGVACTMTGCKKKKVVVDEPPPPPPPAPTGPVYEEYTLEQLSLDPRVQFANIAMPKDRRLAEAIGSLATAIVNGDHYAAQSMLDGSTAGDVSKMEQVGLWKQATDKIQVVRLCTIFDDENAAQFGLAVQNDKGAFLLGFSGARSDNEWTFTALPIKDRMAPIASALDGSPLTPRGGGTAVAFAVSTETKPTGRLEEDTSGGGGDSGGRPGLGPKKPTF